MPNSPWMTAQIAPEVCSPEASSSRIRRRTGSPSTSNACTSGALGRRAAGVGRRGAGRGGPGGRRVVTGRDRGRVPGVAAAGQAGPALVGGEPRGGRRRVVEVPGRQVQRQPEQAHVPADTGGAGSELDPPLGGDVGGV